MKISDSQIKDPVVEKVEDIFTYLVWKYDIKYMDESVYSGVHSYRYKENGSLLQVVFEDENIQPLLLGYGSSKVQEELSNQLRIQGWKVDSSYGPVLLLERNSSLL